MTLPLPQFFKITVSWGHCHFNRGCAIWDPECWIIFNSASVNYSIRRSLIGLSLWCTTRMCPPFKNKNRAAYGATFMPTWFPQAPSLSAHTKWPALVSILADRWPTCPEKLISHLLLVCVRPLSGQLVQWGRIPYGALCKPIHHQFQKDNDSSEYSN